MKEHVAAVTLLAALLGGCQEYVVVRPPPPPPADPPGTLIDAQGEPPSDWETCGTGHFSLYFNLSVEDPQVGFDLEDTDVGANLPGTDPIDPEAVPYWFDDHLAFSKYDVSLEFGPNWWPVDEGLADDPHYFAAQWTSWLRVWDDSAPVSIVIGAGNDVFVQIGEDMPIVRTDVRYAPESLSLDLNTGVYPVTIRYAQRKGDEGGFRFRVTNPEQQARICWPDFPEEEPAE